MTLSKKKFIFRFSPDTVPGIIIGILAVASVFSTWVQYTFGIGPTPSHGAISWIILMLALEWTVDVIQAIIKYRRHPQKTFEIKTTEE
jgi:asparagine N-glycosylation enzyme membrane subunit Stt3